MNFKEKQPNFLLVGAAKSGTTTLYNYLKAHPQIYMPTRKEPLYFISEVIQYHKTDKWMRKAIKNNKGRKVYIDNIDDYLKLFECASNEIAIGEATATYLYYHNHSIPKIKKELGDVKILIILRNPIHKVFSQYKYLKRGGAEPLSLLKAIQEEDRRIAKNYNSLYHYISQGLYFRQVKDFVDNFSSVKIVLLEDLNKDLNYTMDSIFKFLSVDENAYIPSGEIFNKTGYVPKRKVLNKLILQFFFPKELRYIAKKYVPGLYHQMKNKYFNFNSFHAELSTGEIKVLYKYFYEDILRLEAFLGRDLTDWKAYPLDGKKRHED